MFPDECQCPSAGHCPHANRAMSATMHGHCQSDKAYRYTLAGVPFQQRPNDARRSGLSAAIAATSARVELPCVYRSEDEIEHAPCGCHVYQCAIHQVCVPWRGYKLKPGIHVCDECTERRLTLPAMPEAIEPDHYFALRKTLPTDVVPTPAAMQTGLRAVAERRTAMPADKRGRGIVFAAGGWRFLCGVFVSTRMIRWLGCEYPIEVWYNGDLDGEFTPDYLRVMDGLGVTFHDAAAELRRLGITRRSALNGWPLKPVAYLLSSFAEVLGLDADCYPVLDPRPLFEHPKYREHGAVLWPDLSKNKHGAPLEAAQWEIFGLADRRTPGIESGQVLIDKNKHWHSLAITSWLNDHHDFCYLPTGPAGMLGDKDTFAIGFHAADEWGGDKSHKPYVNAPPTRWLHVAFMQHGLDGETMFVHRCRDKPRVGPFSYGTPQRDRLGRMIRCDAEGKKNPPIAHEWKIHELVAEYAAKLKPSPAACAAPIAAGTGPPIQVLVPMIFKPDLNPWLLRRMRENLAKLIRCNPRFAIDVVEFDEPFTNEPGERIWAKVGRARNHVIEQQLLRRHEYVLWIDADIVRYPADILTTLHAANPDGITAPAVMIEDDNKFYDWAAFVEQDDAGDLVTFSPEAPYWRFPDRIQNGRLELAGVGSMYLMPAWPYKLGARHADTPWTDHWPICETVRRANSKVVCLTEVRVDHAELPRYGEPWH